QFTGRHCPGAATNADAQPQGFCGPSTCLNGGSTWNRDTYSFFIEPNKAASFWIFNPEYIPSVQSGQSCGGSTQVDGFITPPDSIGFYTKYPPTTNNLKKSGGNFLFDDPRFYFNTTFTIYGMQSQFDRTTDTQVWTRPFLPFTNMPAD